MKKKIPVIIGFIAVILFAIWYGYTDRTHKIYDNNVNTATYSGIGIIQEDGEILQSFVCEENEIDGFYIKCDPSGDYADTVVKLKVIDAKTGEVISEGSDVGANIRARKLHKFSVDPIKGYKGQTLTLSVTEEGSTDTDGITLYYQPSDQSVGNFTVNGDVSNGVFVMKTFTSCFDIETFISVFAGVMFIWVFMWLLYRLFK